MALCWQWLLSVWHVLAARSLLTVRHAVFLRVPALVGAGQNRVDLSCAAMPDMRRLDQHNRDG